MHIVMLAEPLMEGRAPITSFTLLEALADEVISTFNRWDKYSKPGLASCPNLALSSTVKFSLAQEAPPALDIPDSVLDIPGVPFKKAKLVTQVEEKEGRGESSKVVKAMLAEPVREDQATYGEYMKGRILVLESSTGLAHLIVHRLCVHCLNAGCRKDCCKNRRWKGQHLPVAAPTSRLFCHWTCRDS